MTIKELNKVKELLFKLIITKETKYINLINLMYLDSGADAKLTSQVNNLIRVDIDTFYEFLQYQAFLQNYNIDEERQITIQEMMSVEILLLEFEDEEGEYYIEEMDEQDKFKVYKEKFLDKK